MLSDDVVKGLLLIRDVIEAGEFGHVQMPPKIYLSSRSIMAT